MLLEAIVPLQESRESSACEVYFLASCHHLVCNWSQVTFCNVQFFWYLFKIIGKNILESLADEKKGHLVAYVGAATKSFGESFTSYIEKNS